MNKKDQKSIRSNLNLLAAKTVHVDELVEALQRMELIESDEINHIVSINIFFNADACPYKHSHAFCALNCD